MNRKRRNSETEDGPSSSAAPPSRPRVNREHIFELVVQGKLQELLQEITDDADLLIRDCDGRNLLHKAVGSCYEQSDFVRQAPVIRHLLAKVPQLTEERNIDGQTPLCLSCQKILYYEMITLLVESNPSTVNMADDNGMTPLHHLGGRHFYCLEDRADDGNYTNKDECLDLARLLIRHGANVNAEDFSGMSPLHNTISKKDWTGVDYDMEMIQLLLESGSKLCSESGNHAISYANSLDQIKYLLDIDKTDINKTDKKGWTPLHYVIKNNLDEETIKLLLKNGARIENNINWLQFARNKRFSFEIIEYSLKNIENCDVNSRDDFGYTLLMIYGTNKTIIQKLLDLGADATCIANNGTNALFTAVPENDLEGVKLLIDNGASPLISDQNGMNILSIICERYLYNHNPNMENNPDYKIAKYLFKLPVFNTTASKPTFCTNHHPQTIILQNFQNSPQRSIKLLKLLINSNCKEPSLLTKCSINLCVLTYYFEKSFLEPISVLLHSLAEKNRTFDDTTIEAVRLMLEAGYKVSDTPETSVSALTILVAIPEYPLDLVDDFISNGASVISSALEISFVMSSSDRKISSGLPLLKHNYKIPDALLVSFLMNDMRTVRKLLPYWTGPPMLLLIFKPALETEVRNVELWFKFLSKFGYVPHGTELYMALSAYMEHLRTAFSVNGQHNTQVSWILGQFAEFQQTPRSLRELARCAVRLNMSEKLQNSDKTLPCLLTEVCPPGLKQYLLMQSELSSEQVNGLSNGQENS